MATDTSSDKDINVLNRSGLNQRRACMNRALTLLACVCKPAAAKLTSNNERSQAWHSATDWMRPSPSSGSTSASDPAKSVLVAYTCMCTAPLHEHECVPAPSPCLCSMVPFAQHALAAVKLCGRRSGACNPWRRVGKADHGSEQIRRGGGDAVLGDD